MAGNRARAALLEPNQIIGKAPFRVLVIEDDQVHFLYVQHLLELIFSGRLAVEWARDRHTAVERLRSGAFDVCLLDYLILDGNAREILEEATPSLLDTAIIVVSAFEDKEFVLEALRSGADDYVIKGRFTAPELERAIQFSVYRKYKEVALRRRALYDPLTGLANRDLLFDRLEEMRKYALRHQARFGVAVIDIDNLKKINDAFGHEAGDMLIQSVGQSLTGALRDSDIVARIGGDEMVAVMKDVGGTDHLGKVCANIDQAIRRERLFFRGEVVAPTCSIGAAMYPDSGTDLQDLVRTADQAMYQVKRNGGGGWRVV